VVEMENMKLKLTLAISLLGRKGNHYDDDENEVYSQYLHLNP
jgi:hypothetical protein